MLKVQKGVRMNAVAENLKTLRAAAGLTQEELAERLSVTRQAVSSWETGRSEPDIDTLLAVAEALDTDISALIYGPKEAPYQAVQKKRLILCAVLLFFVLAAIVCRFTLQPWLLEYKSRTFQILPYYLYIFSVPSIGAACAGALIPCLVSLFTRVRLPKAARVCLLAAGVICCAAPVLFTLQILALMAGATTMQPVFTGLHYVVASTSSVLLFFRYLPFTGGLCLFLGASH
jgi:transcriptional regulator with XRE-family HTH domain